MEHKNSSFVKWSLVIGIVIVMNLFFNYAISLVYKAPNYQDYYRQEQVVPSIDTKEECIAVGGQWNEQLVPKSSEPVTVRAGYCDPNYTKQQQYETAMKDYNKVVFLALVVLGVISLVGGTLLAHIVLSLAFSWGGVLSLFIASVRYWSDANNILKVLILAVALGSLIWVAIKKFA
ncbi:MAG: protein of unknown function with transrane region [Candidatus Nomurabacteria bacterium]|nr:protein of unknown function with transrane region [Candidatus Nomurabacteria bacterium]